MFCHWVVYIVRPNRIFMFCKTVFQSSLCHTNIKAAAGTVQFVDHMRGVAISKVSTFEGSRMGRIFEKGIFVDVLTMITRAALKSSIWFGEMSSGFCSWNVVLYEEVLESGRPPHRKRRSLLDCPQ